MKGLQIDSGKVFKAVIAILMALIATGCSSLQSSFSGTSWSQTAVNEEEQQQLSNSPQGDLDMLP